MAKTFAPRVAKKSRKVIDLAERLSGDSMDRLFKKSDEKLLKGAKLDEIKLADIVVQKQVRTKFNDGSLRELSANIEANGLIQPLVIHRVENKYTLICGERRFRAMSLIKMETCPCFIIEQKSDEELMAIQFSENSSREELHYIDKADGILNYQKATKVSERKIQAALGISKSEVHRSLLIAKMTKKVKEAAKMYDIEKYVLLELGAVTDRTLKKKLTEKVVKGDITKRTQLKKAITSGVVKVSKKGKASKEVKTMNMSANAFLKALNSKSKSMKLDKKTRDALKNLMEETQEVIDG